MNPKALPQLSVRVITHDIVVCSAYLQAQAGTGVQLAHSAFEAMAGDVLRHQLTAIVTTGVCGARS